MKKRTKLSVEQLECRSLLSATPGTTVVPVPIYSIDGTGNNALHPDWGSTNEQFLRQGTVEYGDGISAPAGANLPSAREISNAIAAQSTSVLNDRHLTDMVWVWGQFIDHDMDLTGTADPVESMPIAVPTGDATFDPTATGQQTLDFTRSAYDPATGTSVDNPRQQLNQITSWLDGSMVYGSDATRAAALRTFAGGHLKTSAGDLLPFNTDGLDNAGGTDASLFLGGDIRANENNGLTAMDTLWVREHNRVADQIAAANPSLNDEQIYQQARSWVIAEMQAVTYNEFLPALLGEGAVSPYHGYNPNVDPDISNLFATAAYRFGHSMVSPELLRLNNDGTTIAAGNISLGAASFNPQEITANGIDSLLLGLSTQNAQEVDPLMVDDLRNVSFGPGAGGIDLAALDIQRGRDHGLPDYNQARIDMGLPPVRSWADVTDDPQMQAKLQSLYGNVNNMDVWVGVVAEKHLPGSSVGALTSAVLVDQFSRLRDGDPNWFEHIYSGRQLDQLEHTTLSDVIRRNTTVTNIQSNVFYDPSVLYYHGDPRTTNLGVVVTDGTVNIVDQQQHTVLASQPTDKVSQVIVVGSDRLSDQVMVDLSHAQTVIPDGILVYGGAGGNDALTIRGTPQQDHFVVNRDTVTLNNQVIHDRAFEQLHLLATPRQDQVIVQQPSLARLDVLPDLNSPPPQPMQPPRQPQSPPPHHAVSGQPTGQQQPPPPMFVAMAGDAGLTATQQFFVQMRQDLLKQARGVLTEEQYQAFAAGLSGTGGPGPNSGQAGMNGNPPRRPGQA